MKNTDVFNQLTIMISVVNAEGVMLTFTPGHYAINLTYRSV